MASWFVPRDPSASESTRLVCFPPAGGGTGSFHTWRELQGLPYEVWYAMLPGHIGRLRDPLLRDAGALARAAASALVPMMDRPVALFGHSLGSLIIYEMVHALGEEGWPLPTHLFVAACVAPRHAGPLQKPPVHLLADDDLVECIDQMGGIPSELRLHPEILRIALPAIRADVQIFETYRDEERDPVPCPIVSLIGRNDALTPKDCALAWRQYTSGEFAMEEFEGSHFFVQDEPKRVADFVSTLVKK